MCVPAAARTGKSHLIKSLTEYFKITDRLSILRKLAPTSNAANQMGEGGLTMQSFLHYRFSTKINQQRKSSIENEWNHVKYVFLDEVSMVGLDSITKLSHLMSIAKEANGLPFCQLTSVRPSGFLPFDLLHPVGSSNAGTLHVMRARLSSDYFSAS